MTLDVLADRVDLLCEVEAIVEAIAVLEQQHGLDAVKDERRRVQMVRAAVLQQLSALLDAATAETIH